MENKSDYFCALWPYEAGKVGVYSSKLKTIKIVAFGVANALKRALGDGLLGGL